MIEVRQAWPEEWPQVGALTVAAYVADGILDPGHWYAEELRDTSARATEAELLVAVEGGAVLGTITLAAAGTPWAEVAEPGEHEIRMLAVDPAARGRGVAGELVLAAMRRSREAGATRLVLTTIEAMGAAQRLYSRLGMVRVPERDWAVEAGAALVYVADLVDRPGAGVEASTWRPLRTVRVGPWRAGLSGGFTRRANSALLVGDPDAAVDALDDLEAAYVAEGLRTVIRTATERSPEAAAPGLRAELDRRGYRAGSVTRVLARPVRPADRDLPGVLAPGVTLTVAAEPDDAWLAGWLGSKTLTAGSVDPGLARSLLTGSPSAYLTAADRDSVIGVIRAASVEDWVALSCLVVSPRARRRGLGAALTRAALDLPAATGVPRAERAFLQVEVSNVAARALYAALGFVEVDEYAYAER